jgi:hypothetical protein
LFWLALLLLLLANDDGGVCGLLASRLEPGLELGFKLLCLVVRVAARGLPQAWVVLVIGIGIGIGFRARQSLSESLAIVW